MNTQRKHEPEVDDAVVVAEPAGRTATGVIAEQPTVASRHPTSETPVVVAPTAAAQALPPSTRRSTPVQHERTQVRIAPHVLDLVTIPALTPKVIEVAREQRDLNEVIHGVLIIGLALSTALMLVGISLDLFYQHELPMAVPDIGEVLERVAVLRPSGFLALGLLALITTPILRVIGSILAFVYARDWRYAGVTTLVLLALIISLLLGKE